MTKKLPPEIVWRKDKVAYEPPQKLWMENEMMKDYIHEAKKKLVSNGILNSSVLSKAIVPAGAYEADGYDWRYLCAAQML